MLHLLQRCGGSMGVDELAEAVGLHVNTAREHLECLIDSGFVSSEPEQRSTRGRPRILYRAVERVAPATTDGWARDELLRLLVVGYGRRLPSASSAAEDAGCVWGRSLLENRPKVVDAAHGLTGSGPERAQLDALQVHFQDLGFEPECDAERLEVRLHRCPFRDLAHKRPEVMCSVHLGLARGVLAQQGGPLTVESLDRIGEPRQCVLRLARARQDGQALSEPDPGVPAVREHLPLP